MALAWPRDGQHILIGGEWVKLDGESIPAISPLDEQVIGAVPAARAEHVDLAVEAATPALSAWADLGALGRVPYLKAFARAIAEHKEELAELETLDGGLTARTAKADVQTGIDSLDLFSSYAVALTGSTFAAPAGSAAYTVREPYGIAARIIPFNHPVMFAIQNAAPVLLAGNAVIIKPPEQASLSTLALGEIARSVFPPGIFSVLTGFGHEVGASIVAHPDIPRIGFTGSVPTGRAILRGGAEHIKHVTLELGGKNPLIITDGADMDLAARAAVSGMNFTHAGQSCQSTSRIIIQDSIYDEMVERIADRMRALVIGDPRDLATDVGPLAFRKHYERVMDYISIGKNEGARCVVGGERPSHMEQGLYIEPTLFADVTTGMRIAREEIFGPVTGAMRYHTDEEALRIANDTEFGLSSRVIADTLDHAQRLGRGIKAGTTLLNTTGRRLRCMPFGGYKQSGIGKQSCLEEVLSYTEEKSVFAGI